MNVESVFKIGGEIKKLNVGPNDVVVIETAAEYTADEIRQLMQLWREASGLPNRVVILSNSTVRVVRRSE